MKKTVTKDLYDALDAIVTGYGISQVAYAIMQLSDDKAHEAAESFQEVALAKKWAACAEAAVIFEKICLLQFSEE